MQRNGVKTILLQIIGQAVTFNLGTGKDNCLVDTGIAQPVVQQFAFVLGVICPKQDLLDIDVFFLRVVNRDTLRLAHDAGSQLLNARSKRCAKHHGLFAANGQLVNFSQIIREA